MNFLQKRINLRDLKKKLMVTKEESFRGQRAISWLRLIYIYHKKCAEGFLSVTSLTGL